MRDRYRVVGVALALAACSSSSNPPNEAIHDDASARSDASYVADAAVAVRDSGLDESALTGTVERGQYLVDHVLMCGVCHTPSLPNGEPDMTKYLAGSRSYDFKDLDGTIVTVNAENLTSHDPEGLHSWTDGQIRRAITKGIDDEMIAMYPIMPYPEYALLTREDLDSVVKYLRTVPPNDNVVAADYPYFDQNPPVPSLDDSKIPHTTLASSDAAFAAAERGRYLAKTACLNCHTEELSYGIPDLSKAFAGGKTYTFTRDKPAQTSTNITPDATGLAGWSVADIATAIKTNQDKGTGRALCNTHPGGPDRLGKMTDADLTDLATYIHTLPPVANGPFQCLK
ncbi:MAG: putative diheme cytochrome c-553 [Myxococcaceae bacterium]|nr:putative diheme cytochrome c-553 [Myxococcaceae bacterium]